MSPTARHRAPMSAATAMLEGAARCTAPSPGADTTIVLRHIDETARILAGRHAADPALSRVRNLVAFRSLMSDIEVPQ